MPNLFRYGFWLPPRVNRYPLPLLLLPGLLGDRREDRPYTLLNLFLFIPFLSVASTLLCFFRRDIEEERQVRRGKSDIRRATPFERKSFGGGECYP